LAQRRPSSWQLRAAGGVHTVPAGATNGVIGIGVTASLTEEPTAAGMRGHIILTQVGGYRLLDGVGLIRSDRDECRTTLFADNPERQLTLRQADQARDDFAQILDELDFVKSQLARLPTRSEAALIGLRQTHARRRGRDRHRLVAYRIRALG